MPQMAQQQHRDYGNAQEKDKQHFGGCAFLSDSVVMVIHRFSQFQFQYGVRKIVANVPNETRASMLELPVRLRGKHPHGGSPALGVG